MKNYEWFGFQDSQQMLETIGYDRVLWTEILDEVENLNGEWIYV